MKKKRIMENDEILVNSLSIKEQEKEYDLQQAQDSLETTINLEKLKDEEAKLRAKYEKVTIRHITTVH